MSGLEFTDSLSGEEYNRLRACVGWETLTERQARDGLAHSAFLTAARDGGRAVAMGRVLFDFGYTAYIGDVIVSPEFQGKGLGSAVVRSLIEKVCRAADPGDRILFILGAAKGKEPFYEKLGFQQRPNEGEGHGMSKWVRVGP